MVGRGQNGLVIITAANSLGSSMKTWVGPIFQTQSDNAWIFRDHLGWDGHQLRTGGLSKTRQYINRRPKPLISIHLQARI